ncbi:MAG: hypothetical protein EBY45_02305 [Gammaproteobacteria bacterium]|nr:hypothetical protein [Gammaproteobacteria bacterium]
MLLRLQTMISVVLDGALQAAHFVIFGGESPHSMHWLYREIALSHSLEQVNCVQNAIKGGGGDEEGQSQNDE